MKKYLLLWIFITLMGFPQNSNESVPDVKISGYIKNDFFFDSRQTAALREGHFLLYPLNESFDANGKDINAKPSFNALSIQSRICAKFTGPKVLGAKSGGLLEGEFFGTSDPDINGFRLRHAFITFDWENTSLLFGQTWHPMLVIDVIPQVISFNTGAPFQPFARNPQIRLTQSFGKIYLIAALMTQRDVTSNGPNGFSSMYLKNNVLPNAHLQLQYKNESIVTGVGVDYKSLLPRTVTSKNIITDEKVSSFAGIIYAKYYSSGFTWLAEGVYGQNLADLFMFGGYAVSKYDSLTGYEKYTTLGVYSFWTDLTFGTEIQPGIFFGFTKNLGAKDRIVGASYTRINDIDKIFRVSPRIVFNFSKIRLAAETEFTSASYGTSDGYGKITNTKDILNVRGLFAVYYFL